MKNFGLIGYPLEHSFSPAYFTEKFAREGIVNATYQAIPLKDEDALVKFLSSSKIEAFNVTIPYKQVIVRYLNKIDRRAAEMNSVNLVVRQGKKLCGYNTDAPAFMKSILPLITKEKQALIFGSGGSSRAVAYVFSQLGISYRIVSRNKNHYLQYNNLDEGIISQHRILVNTTPLGMYPDNSELLPIPYQGIGKDHLCYDLIYNPETTAFLRMAGKSGARIKNGMGMLIGQAELSWEIMNDRNTFD